MQEASWWMDILRPFFYSLDNIVYSLIETLYNLLIFVSDLTLFGSEEFSKFTTKVYLILGIIMLFKIAFSLITLFANPDDLMDSGKGVTGIVRRIIISLVVITFIPTVFQTAYRIQTIIVHDNVIGNFFLGDIVKSDEDGAQKIQEDAGKMISLNIISAFYYPEDFLWETETDKDGITKLKESEDGGVKSYVLAFNKSELSSDACITKYKDGAKGDKKCNGELYYEIKNETYSVSDYGAFVRKDYGGAGEEDVYIMRYMYIISTIAGIAVAWIFLGFCFDIAIRSVKLSVLQLIAPIPVFSYIDPKKGESIFKNWYQACLSTYVSLFMRLILIFFVIYICYLISDGEGILQIQADGTTAPMSSGSNFDMVAKALMIFGVLWFAKDAPKLFGEMFGIKLEGSFGTTLAKMGIAATGLAAGVGGAKYIGSKYRRGLQKGANRRRENELLEKDSLDAEEKEELAKIRHENKWSTGLKQNFNATRYGMTSGFMGGWAAKKISGAGLKQGVMKANKTEKIRNDGVSFAKQVKEELAQYAGVAGKYGDFGEFKTQIRDAENERRRLKSNEEEYRRQYVQASKDFSKDYKLNAEQLNAIDAAMATGDKNKMASARNDVWKEYEKTLDASIRGNSVELSKFERTFHEKYDEVVRINDAATNFDKLGQKLEKQINELNKKQESVKVK